MPMKGYEIVLYFVAQKVMKQRRHTISRELKQLNLEYS